MAYQAGTLLAAGGDVYEQLMDIIKSFSETAGWTTNLYADDSSYYTNDNNHTYHATGGYAGKRLHMQKTINGTVRCIALKTSGDTDKCPFRTAYANYGNYSGLSIIGSTGYSATRWSEQTGGSYTGGGGSYFLGAAAYPLPTDILNYYLFHIIDGLADVIYLQVQTLKGYTGVVWGTTSLDVFVVGGSSSGGQDITETEENNSLLFRNTDVGWGNQLCVLYAGGACNGWYVTKSGSTIGVKLPYQRLVSIDTYHEAHLLLYCSPDNFKGNAPFIPVNLQLVNSSSVLVDLGILPGVKYINMKNIASLREEVYGMDTYKLFRQYNVDDAYEKFGGLAFVIS